MGKRKMGESPTRQIRSIGLKRFRQLHERVKPLMRHNGARIAAPRLQQMQGQGKGAAFAMLAIRWSGLGQ